MAHTHSYLINGSFDHTLSPFDRGFAYGDGVFRTFVMRDGMPDNWPFQYQKLVADCAVINIVCPSAELLMSDLQQLFLLDETAVAKIIVTRGEGERGYTPPPVTMPLRVLIKSALSQYPEENFSQGVQLQVCETRLASQPKLAGVKHLNRLENVLARMEWNDPTFAEGLMLDTNDDVIECTSANIFARFGDTLLTPQLHQCGVAGVTRQRIIDVAYTLSLKILVETFNLEKLLTADEVIICNSLYGAWQVKGILQRTWLPEPLAANIRSALKP
jgi:4-amino-4-deoxychorismate lyase